jgi:hypothetical protein
MVRDKGMNDLYKHLWNIWILLVKNKDVQNYWVFGLFPSSGILENRKHDVSETRSVSVLK